MTVEKMLGAHRAFRELLELRLPYERVRQLRRLAAWLEEELAQRSTGLRNSAARLFCKMENCTFRTQPPRKNTSKGSRRCERRQ